MSKNLYVGSSLDNLLEGTRAEIESIALKRAIAWQIQQAMEE